MMLLLPIAVKHAVRMVQCLSFSQVRKSPTGELSGSFQDVMASSMAVAQG